MDKVIERYEEGLDIFGYQFIKFAIATDTNKNILRWILYITPSKKEHEDELDKDATSTRYRWDKTRTW